MALDIQALVERIPPELEESVEYLETGVHERVLENAIRRAMNEAYEASKWHGRVMFAWGIVTGVLLAFLVRL